MTGLSESATCERASPGPGGARSADPLTAAELWRLPVVCPPSGRLLLAVRLVYCPASVHGDQPWRLCISSCNLRSGAWLGRAARAGKWPALLCLMPCCSPTPVHCGCPPSVPCFRVCATSPPGSHRLWPSSESVVTAAPPAIAGAPDLPKTRSQSPLRSGWSYTFWSSRTQELIGRPRCNL